MYNQWSNEMEMMLITVVVKVKCIKYVNGTNFFFFFLFLPNMGKRGINGANVLSTTEAFYIFLTFTVEKHMYI